MNLHRFHISNCDTDSISFRKEDNSEFTQTEMENLITEVNSIFPEGIAYEDDGYFDRVLIIKAKNYCLVEHGSDKLKKKGSSITDTKKESALLELLSKYINDIMYNNSDGILDIYNEYISEVCNIQDMNRWTTKRSVSSSVLNPTRTNEQKVLDAIGDNIVQEGDKVYIFSDIDGERQSILKGKPVFLKSGKPKMEPHRILRLVEDYNNSYDLLHYLDRVYKTTVILETVIDMSKIVRYTKTKLHLLDLEN